MSDPPSAKQVTVIFLVQKFERERLERVSELTVLEDGSSKREEYIDCMLTYCGCIAIRYAVQN